MVVFRLRNARAEHVIARLSRVLNDSGEALARGAIILVEDARHRVRSLPLEIRDSASAPETGAARKRHSFERFVGIDYSGAATPTSGLPGLRVYLAERDGEPIEVSPSAGKSRYWTRRGVAEWLVRLLSEPRRTLVGIDHGFSFPIPYFEAHGLPRDWTAFLADFQEHWPTDQDDTSVELVRRGERGNGAKRMGETGWRRLTEQRSRPAKSVFQFDVQGSVAKSTHSGLPWLKFLREKLGSRLHIWPFDGWRIPPDRSALVEVYPRLWKDAFPKEQRNDDQHDAYSVARWMCEADGDGTLGSYLEPDLTSSDLECARVEGWILGVA